MQGVGTKMGTVFKSLPIEIERPPLNPNSWLSHLPMLFALDVLGEVAPPKPGPGPLADIPITGDRNSEAGHHSNDFKRLSTSATC